MEDPFPDISQLNARIVQNKGFKVGRCLIAFDGRVKSLFWKFPRIMLIFAAKELFIKLYVYD